MEGVGRIFEAFRDGVLEDDDEVALLHAPAELGYQPLTEPMVNIRATLAKAVREGVVGAASQRSVTAVAKALFYQERAWPTVLSRAGDAGVARADLKALSAFCEQSRVDQKRLDALAMLRSMRNAPAEAAPVAFHLEETWLSEAAKQAARRERPACEAADTAVLDDLRLRGKEWRALYRRALDRLALKAHAQRRNSQVNDEDVIAELDRIRRLHRLESAEELNGYLRDNDLDHESFVRLAREKLQVASLRRRWDPSVATEVVNAMKLKGAYAPIKSRQRELTGLPTAQPRPQDQEILAWYVRTRLEGRAPPDLLIHARSIGFPDLTAFLAALRREWASRAEPSGRADA